jgi:hypothetical protein
MARTVASLPAGSRISDYISLGVIAKFFPLERVRAVLAETGRASIRERDLPAHVVVYYVIALALYMRSSTREVLRCLLEGVQWLLDPSVRVRVAGKSGISQARSRLGAEPLRRLYDGLVGPIADKRTKGAWYRDWRLVSLDGSTLDVADTRDNEKAYGRPGASRGESAYPSSVSWPCWRTEPMCCGRRGWGRFPPMKGPWPVTWCPRWAGACSAWPTASLPATISGKERPNGGGLAVAGSPECPPGGRPAAGRWLLSQPDLRLHIGPPPSAQRDCGARGGLPARPGAGRRAAVRLITTILDPKLAPAKELAALYHERWEIETALDELKTHLRGAQIVLRSKTPELVEQEFWGLLMAHFAIRGLMHEAALKADEDPDRLSFLHAVRVVQRRLARYAAIPPSAEESPA